MIKPDRNQFEDIIKSLKAIYPGYDIAIIMDSDETTYVAGDSQCILCTIDSGKSALQAEGIEHAISSIKPIEGRITSIN